MTKKKPKHKYYMLLDKDDGDTGRIFKGNQPRQAALKCARRGITDICLRERGTTTVHQFNGNSKMVAKSATAPDWLPDMVKKASLRKVGVYHLE